jgi:homoserine O-acetyltransferase
MTDYKIFEAGDVVLQSGLTYRKAKLAYKTYGTLNATKSNVIVYPTSYGAQHTDTEWMIGTDKALDPSKYFIIIPNKFGNGLSSSPSNTPAPFDRGRYPHFTMADNVRVQERLLREVFGIERVALVYGFSMGAQQAFHWGALFPDKVERIAPVCGSAKTARHNFVFLEGVKAALTADPAWQDGYFATQPLRGLRAMGRVYAGWALSQDFYREELYLTLGFSSLEDFLISGWEGNFRRRDANDLLAMLWTWSTPISAPTSSTAAISARRSARSRRGRSSCRRRPTSISASRTIGAKLPRCPTPSCARSHRSGATGPATRRRTLKTKNSSTTRCGSCSRLNQRCRRRRGTRRLRLTATRRAGAQPLVISDI